MTKKTSHKIMTSKAAKRIYAISLVIVGIALTTLIFIFANKDETINKVTWIEKLSLSVQIVSGVYIVTGAIIGVWQYCISTKSEEHNNKSEKVRKAIDLAGYYKDNIIKPFGSVTYVYDKIGALDIIKTINKDNMINFDYTELISNLDQEQIEALKNSIKTPEFIAAVCEANYIYNLNTHEKSDILLFESINDDDDEAKNEKHHNLIFSKIATNYMNNEVLELMNNLEYFAMYFTHNIADDTVIFQSLHQSYFDMVETMYYYISNQNTTPNDKFYVNVIKLYTKWKEKDKKNQNDYNAAKREYDKCIRQHDIGTVLDDVDNK